MLKDFVCNKCGTIENKYANSLCRKCYNKIYSKKYYKDNKQKFVDAAYNQYYNNREESLKYKKEYWLKNKGKLKSYNHEYYLKNKERMQRQMKEYYEENKKELNKRGSIRKKEDMKNNPYLRLVENLRSRISMAVKYHKEIKACSAIKLLGTNINTVREHLQNQFKDGMTWENQGAWHVDHIIPCNSFDLTKEEEQRKCFHYTNLQPLWAKENLSKGPKHLYS